MEEKENKIVRGTVDMDYVPLESIGEENNQIFNNQTQENVEQLDQNINENISIQETVNVETFSTNTTSSVGRNEINIGFVDLESKTDENTELTQDELDENINGETHYNEAGKKEIRMEVDPVVTQTHKKDAKIKKLMKFGLLVVIIILAILLFNASKNNKHKAFERNITSAASAYINDELNQSVLSSLYLEKTDEITISVKDLQKYGYYKGEFIDPKTKEDVSEKLVKIYLKDNKLTYEFPYEK